MNRKHGEIFYQLRYALPFWILGLFTNWWPDNRVTIKIRGYLFSLIIYQCGKNFTIAKDVTLLSIDKLKIGDNVYIAKGAWINAVGSIVIEDEVVIAPYVVISSNNHGFRDGSVRFGGSHPAPIVIGRGTWLAAHVSITAGVIVGRGNLVAANAVVTKSTPNDLIVGGVPAKVLGKRFDNPSEIFRAKNV